MSDYLDQTIKLHWSFVPKVNFACQQNAFAVLRDLQIENTSEETQLRDVVITLSSNPKVFKDKKWRLDQIIPGSTNSMPDRDVELDGSVLLNVSEAMTGTVSLTVEVEGNEVLEESTDLEVLAFNEWGGAGFMPELLAAFANPTDPAVDAIIAASADILRKANKNPAIDGYEAKSRERVWEIASAIYTAIANRGIEYSSPPASFEKNGQKIRLQGHVWEHRVGTCLDTTMLFAAALEQAGLHPIVAMPEGHAFVGVWLQPEGLSSVVVEEAEILRKCSQLKELILIETTYLTTHPAPPFSKAVERANAQIVPENDNTFIAAVDIKRARAHRITPLGFVSEKQTPTQEAPQAVEQLLEEAPALPSFDNELEEELPDTPEGRLERWQRKLLDLTARNPLLNHRVGRGSLKVICPDPGLLEDKLADGDIISIKAIPRPGNQAQDEEIHAQRTGEIITDEYARDALGRKQVLIDLEEKDLERRAVELYRKAQTALQEGGANTLYLALGYLLWKRDEKDEKRFRAPLILMPISVRRQSVRSGVKISAHDDEPRFNTTLLEMLRRDFEIDITGLDGSLPEDHSGIDVAGIWNKIRKAVKDAPGFEVVEDVVLGHFSFAKYLMWKDLVDRTDALKENPVVRHLIDTPREPFGQDIEFVEPKNLDRDYTPSDLLLPLPGDASQMAAVAAAESGKNFIIIGPPGTGKSQTISNMIGHLLGKGKKVLFVSEKTAALEVVHRRLKEIGLGQFCLELHSNKAKKADVLAQLDNAWQSRVSRTVSEWEQEASRLTTLRNTLNALVNRLHTPRKNGLTAYEAIGVTVRDKDLLDRCSFTWPDANIHDQQDLEDMRDIANHLRVQALAVGNFKDSPFQNIHHTDWSPQWEQGIALEASKVVTCADNFQKAITSLTPTLGLKEAPDSLQKIKKLIELSPVIRSAYRQTVGFALAADGQDVIDLLEITISHLKSYAENQSKLSCAYDSFAWRELDGEKIRHEWIEAEKTWWPKKALAKRKIIKAMQAAGAKGKPDVAKDSEILVALRKAGLAIDKAGDDLKAIKDWKEHESDPGSLDRLSSIAKTIRIAAGLLADDPQDLISLRQQLKSLITDGNDLLAPDAPTGLALATLEQAGSEFLQTYESYLSMAGEQAASDQEKTDNTLSAIKSSAQKITAHRVELNSWCMWQKRRKEALDKDLSPLIDAIETGLVPAEEIPDVFEASYCAWWSGAIIGEDEVLRTFSAPAHEDSIKRFQEHDERFQKLTAEYIAACLSGLAPSENSFTKSSQWGIVKREITKKRAHKPVRRLLQEAPEVFATLAPCMMMSPLSVAQYLPPDQDLFDVVIFDEASQITVWDAVGSIARGKQVIVAGDPRQMPPTNFFGRSDNSADLDVDYEGDLESILDELQSANIPELTLNFHYRSKRESLIAFSNNQYYGNGLITFPAPEHPDNGVKLRKVNGIYARGGARHNEIEAKEIVAEIVTRLQSQDLAIRNSTIGVVTFNSEQQNLILDLLDRARSTNPDIEWAFAEDKEEAVFVKNLESVQGDERDVILFSITYGPDQADHMTMNFGPLNKSGGERRLNVALTRARSELVVFSSFGPDKIDLSKTGAEAVKNLKHFLEFAERGPAALGSSMHGSIGDYESPFEVAVARALKDKGWIVHPQIGVSAYRIDLGVVHPDEPGIYLAGVECDGAMYHSSASAKERDKVRQAVLERLGWAIFRVWSTDWWINKTLAFEKLHLALEALLETDRQDRERKKPKQENVAHDAPTAEITDEDSDMPNAEKDDDLPALNNELTSQVEDNTQMPYLAETSIEESLPKIATAPSVTDDPDEYGYVETNLDSSGYPANPELFYEDQYRSRIQSMIDCIIDTEGPIHETVLVRRIARHHGFQRAGRQIREIVIEIACNRRGRTKEVSGFFFWRKGTVKERLAPARYKNRGEDMRNVDFICPEELQAINAAIAGNNDPQKIAQAIGLQRVTSKTKKHLEEALIKTTV